MKYVSHALVGIIFALFVCMIAPLYAHDPLLVIALMVKNEEPVMQATLKPLLDAHHDHYLIYDTGSTDKTVEITKSLFKQYGVKNGVIVQEPFIDFATSRNRALDLVESHFPHASFILMIDAEWELVNYQGLIQFCKRHQHLPNSYLIRIMNDLCDYYTGRLIRCGCKVRFKGRVHEEIGEAAGSVPRDVYINWRVTQYGRKKSDQRYEKDIEDLLEDHRKNPNDSRTALYIGQSFSCLKKWKDARIWYEKCIAMSGWQEEVFLASYRLGLIYNMLGDWPKALNQLLKAYEIQPLRIEPLVCIAQYYKIKNDKKTCEIFIKKALEIPYPTFNTLALEKDMYLKERYELFHWATT